MIGPPWYPPHGGAVEATLAQSRHALMSTWKRDQMMRRIIWWVVLFLFSTVVTLLATR